MILASQILIIFILLKTSISSEVIVTTKYGKIQGLTLKPEDSQINCYGFIGIPFAKPPIGELRFEKPHPADHWTEPFQATMHPSRCIQGVQFFPGPENTPDSEDCLYLNIIAPNKEIKAGNKYPIMFWVYGGGFLLGSAFEYEPAEICRNLVSRDVIVVVPQYRLGVFGFLSSGDKVLPGNLGLHDQIMALQWIHENIANFGGDSSRVTLFGQSAGGGSVSILSYLPQTQNFFSQAIAQSGSAWAYWAISPKPIEAFNQMSITMGCGDEKMTNSHKLACFKTKSVEEFETAFFITFGKSMGGKERVPGKAYKGGGHGVAGAYDLFSPTIDRDLIPAGGIAELARAPNKKPYITGTCDQVTPINFVSLTATV